jgi:hypothetical protein
MSTVRAEPFDFAQESLVEGLSTNELANISGRIISMAAYFARSIATRRMQVGRMNHNPGSVVSGSAHPSQLALAAASFENDHEPLSP